MNPSKKKKRYNTGELQIVDIREKNMLVIQSQPLFFFFVFLQNTIYQNDQKTENLNTKVPIFLQFYLVPFIRLKILS